MNRSFFLLLMLVWIANPSARADSWGSYFSGFYQTKWQPISPNLAVKFKIFSRSHFTGEPHPELATDVAPPGFEPSYAEWIIKNTGTCTLKPFQFRAVYSYVTLQEGEYETINRNDHDNVRISLKPGEVYHPENLSGGLQDHYDYWTATNSNNDQLQLPIKVILDAPLECEPENKK